MIKLEIEAKRYSLSKKVLFTSITLMLLGTCVAFANGTGVLVTPTNKLVGIGAALDVGPNQTIVIRQIFSSSPASKAGLEVGDIITTLQQDSSSELIQMGGKKLEDVIALVRGPRGTTVTLGILKPTGEVTVAKIVRDNFEVAPNKEPKTSKNKEFKTDFQD